MLFEEEQLLIGGIRRWLPPTLSASLSKTAPHYLRSAPRTTASARSGS